MKMSKLVLLSPLLLAMWLILPSSSLAKGIKVEVVPSKLQPAKGERITISINLDVSGTSELLGAVVATLKWDNKVLRYIDYSAGKTEGFGNIAMNHQKASEGQLVFACFNPYGGVNVVNIVNVSFEVIGTAGSILAPQVEMRELVAARTFVDLRPYLEGTVTGVDNEFSVLEVPKEYELQQNYPNPFNAGTEIRFALPSAGHVRLEIYNTLGAKVRTVVDAPKEAGRYKVHWDGADENGKVASSGVYAYRLQAGSFTAERKMLFVK